MQASLGLIEVFPNQALPFRFAIPPPPSEAVTLQCSMGGAVPTPIAELLLGTACAQTSPPAPATPMELLLTVLLYVPLSTTIAPKNAGTIPTCISFPVGPSALV